MYGRRLVQGNAALLALTLDMSVPPLALLALLLVGHVWLTLLAVWWLHTTVWALAVALAAAALFGLAVLIGWWCVGRRWLSAWELVLAPLYIVRKVPLYLGFLWRRQVELGENQTMKPVSTSAWRTGWRSVGNLRWVQDDQKMNDLLAELLGPFDGPRTLAFVNAHAMNMAATNQRFADDLAQCHWLLRDGSGMTLLARRLGLSAGMNLNGTDRFRRCWPLTGAAG